MKASLQSFGGKARIENVISISYFSLIFSIKAMLAHGWPSSMQFICSLIHLLRDFVVGGEWMGLTSCLVSAVQMCARGAEQCFCGVFLGEMK